MNGETPVSWLFVHNLILKSKGAVVVSLANWPFLTEFDQGIYAPLGRSPIAQSAVALPEPINSGPVGYFTLPEAHKTTEFVDRLLRNQWVKLYVSNPKPAFFADLPEAIVTGLSEDQGLSESVLSLAAKVRGHDWLVLSDGNPGDVLFYYFQGGS